ncbi:TnsA endonuclease N-terminal domain-containing protein [Ralstonia holmesii]|uniref:TnsA endonuclease N-terminal domain-containing protein n=1 Tax=Ralstonia holmesii TaxID=3058602 RepID=UPI003F17005B
MQVLALARFKYQMTAAKLRRFKKERRGHGERASYRPWLTVGDVPSKGRSHRVSCQKTGGRTMHFLSDHEYVAFLELWWDADVSDIREQYPLGLMRTLRIAGQLGVKHPIDQHTGIVLTQTTDLLATRGLRDAETFHAWAVKDRSALSDQRTMDKLEIERRYWSELGVPWQLVVNDGLNSSRALNLDWLLEFENTLRMGKAQLDATCVTRVLEAVREGRAIVAGTGCAALDRRWNSKPGAHLSAFRFLLLSRLLKGNLEASEFSRQLLSSFEVAR